MSEVEYIFLSTGYRGGASTFISDHIKYLSKNNKKIVLVDDIPNVTFSNLPKNTLVKKIKINQFSIISYNKLKKLLFNNKSTKIIFLTNYAFLIRYFFLILQFKKYKIKIILTIHSGLFNINFKRYLSGLIFSFLYKKVDYLQFGSFSAKFWWLKFYPWMKIKKSSVIYNGVEIKKKKYDKKIKNKLLISFVGRIEKENNPDFFLRIAKDYLQKFDDAVFNVYGDGKLYETLKKKYNLSKIKFFGWQKKNKIYNNSDIIIITSYINNFPYVALEAKSYGIPVISSSQGDIKKIIRNNYDGYINYTKSTKKIINFIRKIIKNYKKFSNNSIQRSKFFEIDNACKEFWKNIL